MRKLLIITGLFYLLIAMACGTSKPAPRPAPRPSKPPLTQKPAPPKTPVEERPQLPIQDNYKDIQWVDSERLMPVLEDAQRLKKNVFVVFYATWCAPCKVMEEEIFTQKQVYDFYNEHFINFRTDFDSDAGKTIAQIYEVEKLPTVLLLNPQGVVIDRHLGIATVAELIRMGNTGTAPK
jgi:thiol:disulfide interchange protein